MKRQYSIIPVGSIKLLLFATVLMFLALLTVDALAAQSAPEHNNLLKVYRQALLEDPQIERWQANLDASREAHNQSRAKLLLPTLNATANVTGNLQTVNLQGAAVGLGGSSNYMSYGYTLTLTQPLFHYDRIIALDQAGQRVKKADMEMYTANQDFIIRVAERYFGMLGALDNLNFAKTQREALAQQRDKIHKRFDAGELTIIDITDIDAGYERSVSDEIESERQLQDAREALRELSGQYFETLLPLAKEIPLVLPEPKNEQPWLDQAMSQNPHIVTAAINADITHDEVTKQSAGHMPTLDLVGRNNYLQTGGQFGQYDNLLSTVGLEVNVPLYEGNQANSRMREAAFRHSEAGALLKQEQRSIHRQTRDAFNGVVAGISRIRSLKQTMNSQATSVQSILAGIEVGMRTNLDLVIANKEWFSAQRDYARARYDYILFTLRLKSAAGVLTVEDLQQVNAMLEPE